MRYFFTLLAILCLSLGTKAQFSTYTTKIGDYKGPVKTVITVGDVGTLVETFNEDGYLTKSVNSNKDQYIVFDWESEAFTQKFYKVADDSYINSSVLYYVSEPTTFFVTNGSNASFMWDFDEHILVVSKGTSFDEENLAYAMATINITDEGYDSLVLKDDQIFSKTEVKTYDRDKYGNATRIVTIDNNGVSHETNRSFEYYE